jgi:hypothetical protein
MSGSKDKTQRFVVFHPKWPMPVPLASPDHGESQDVPECLV